MPTAPVPSWKFLKLKQSGELLVSGVKLLSTLDEAMLTLWVPVLAFEGYGFRLSLESLETNELTLLNTPMFLVNLLGMLFPRQLQPW